MNHKIVNLFFTFQHSQPPDSQNSSFNFSFLLDSISATMANRTEPITNHLIFDFFTYRRAEEERGGGRNTAHMVESTDMECCWMRGRQSRRWSATEFMHENSLKMHAVSCFLRSTQNNNDLRYSNRTAHTLKRTRTHLKTKRDETENRPKLTIANKNGSVVGGAWQWDVPNEAWSGR